MNSTVIIYIMGMVVLTGVMLLSHFQTKNKTASYLTLIMLIGGSMNGLALFSNNYQMPVYAGACSFCDPSVDLGPDHSHFIFEEKEEVNFFIFTDILKIPSGVVSIGDVVSVLGFTGVMVDTFMFRKKRWRKE